MNAKTITTVVLLAFVAASIVVAIVKNVGNPGGGNNEAAVAADGLTVYYFHGRARCPACETIEAYAREAVQEGFAEQLADGRMHWQVVDYDRPENQHFVEQFQLIAPTVVVARIDGGVVQSWKPLARVRELAGEKEAFITYVREETRGYLEKP